MRSVETIPPIDRDEMVVLATEEFRRLAELLESLTTQDWEAQTVCDDWTVRPMVAHLLGAAEANASLAENMRQFFRGKRRAKAMGTEHVDGINAVQVGDRSGLSGADLLQRLRSVAPMAVRGRRKVPGIVRRLKIPTGVGYDMTMGHLVDVVYTRDQWLHRVDICAAVDRQPFVSEDHDARIVADVIREWHSHHGEAFELILDGPAGGHYGFGSGGPLIEMDAVEFCLVLSGRLDKDMPLKRPIVF